MYTSRSSGVSIARSCARTGVDVARMPNAAAQMRERTTEAEGITQRTQRNQLPLRPAEDRAGARLPRDRVREGLRAERSRERGVRNRASEGGAVQRARPARIRHHVADLGVVER